MAKHIAIIAVITAAHMVCLWVLLACFLLVPFPPTWLALPSGAIMGASMVHLADELDRWARNGDINR